MTVEEEALKQRNDQVRATCVAQANQLIVLRERAIRKIQDINSALASLELLVPLSQDFNRDKVDQVFSYQI